METARGWLYDGTLALRHDVHVSAEGDGLVILYADGDRSEIPAAKLVYVDSRNGFEVYGHSDVDGWRLGLTAEDAARLKAALPERRRYGRWIDRIGLVKAAAIALVISIGIVLLATRFPTWVAPYVPRSWEDNFGDPIVAGLSGRFCDGAGGQEALDKLARTLAPGAGPLHIKVVNIDIVNAAALPGGNIVIFEELLTSASGPDEVAGVLAHEIAHIENRHVTEAMIRQFTFGFFLAMVGGGTGANIESVLSTRYGRDAEREADRDAIAALSRANISPLGASAFFGRVAEQERRLGALGQGLSYISTHPNPGERQRLFRESAGMRRDFKPSLSSAEWHALANICHNDPDQRGRAGFW